MRARCSSPGSAGYYRSRKNYEQDGIRKILQEELANIAPEADLQKLNPSADLREALDIDSIHFLNLVTAIHHRLGINVPELDYPMLFTLDGAVSYAASKLVGAKRFQGLHPGFYFGTIWATQRAGVARNLYPSGVPPLELVRFADSL